MSGIAPGVRITVLIMSGASSAFVSRGRCSEIAEPERGGYQGAVLYFYDFETGDVYQPF